MTKNKKLLVVISSPLFTLSGYGKHSLDIVNSLIESYDDVWDIRLLSNKWGACSMVEDVDDMLAKKVLTSPLTEQPDIWIQISIPNEFKPVGKYNIGITAGIETTACSGPWIEGVNRMDYILVPSKHAKFVFENTIYDKKDKQGNDLGKLKCTTPIDVIFEGVDLSLFGKDLPIDIDVNKYLNEEVKEDFNFLIVSQWGNGEIFQDRKDVGGAILSFFKAFRNKENAPGLILKCNGAAYSEMDKETIKNKIDVIKNLNEFNTDKLPNVYLLYGQLTEQELNTVYNHSKVKCIYSLTKGEGYSRTFPEFLVSGKPIITTKFSGHLDYLNEQQAVLIPGELKNIHKSVVWKDVIIPESKWLYVDYNNVAVYLKDMFNDYESYVKQSAKLSKTIVNDWNLDKMTIKLKGLMDIFIENNYIAPIEFEDIILPDLDDIKLLGDE